VTQLRTLQQSRREDSLKLKALRMHIKAGVDALKRGEFTQSMRQNWKTTWKD